MKTSEDNQSNLLDLNFDMVDDRSAGESTATITPASFRRQSKIRMLNAMKKQTLAEILGELPEQDESIHIISNGKFDYYTFIPVFIEHLGHIDELYGSTWTMNRNNCENLFEQFDAGNIDKMSIITGLYFKRRETAVYATLVQGMAKRHQTCISCENHAKIILIRKGNKYYVIEGSANWTGNPRIEQNTVTQSEGLYNFHRDWMRTFLE